MGKTTEGGVIDRFRKLEQIRKRYDEYTRAGGPGYKAFLYSAHSDVGALIDRVDALEGAMQEILSHVGGQDAPGCYGAYLTARAALDEASPTSDRQIAEITRLREALGRIAATPLDIYPGEKSEIAQDTLAGKANPNPVSSPVLPRLPRSRT